MKHLHNFDTVAEYEAVKDTLEMPYIVSIDETDGLQFNTEVIRVPQGSGGGDSGANEWQYYDVRNNTLVEGQWELIMTQYPTLVAMTKGGDSGATEVIGGAGLLAMLGVDEAKERLKYIAIDMDVKQYGSTFGYQLMSFKEYEAQAGQSLSDALATFGITQITKEQFYTLE